jgi:hypothetical protein
MTELEKVAFLAAVRAGVRSVLPAAGKAFSKTPKETPLTMGAALKRNVPNFGKAFKETAADWYTRGMLGPVFSGLTAYELISNPDGAGSLLGGVGGGIAGAALMRKARLLPNIGASILGGVGGAHLGEKVLPSTPAIPKLKSPHDPWPQSADSRAYRL